MSVKRLYPLLALCILLQSTSASSVKIVRRAATPIESDKGILKLKYELI